MTKVLRALGDGQALEPRGLSCELLAWELSEREASLERLLADAHGRKLVERSGIDRHGHLLWRLTERGEAFLERSTTEVAQLRPRVSRRFELARRPA
jgi:hypothetical protein